MKLLNRLNTQFIKSSLTLMSGSLIAQILAIIVSAFMTRLYSESEIGRYTLILTAVSMFGSVICLRYDMSIVPETDEHNVFSLVKLSLILSFVLGFLVGIGYSVYCYIKGSLEGFSPFIVAIFVFILLFLTGIGNTLISYNNRKKEYRLMTSVQLIREAGRDVLLVALGFLNIGTSGLLISQVASLSLGITHQSKSLRNSRFKWNGILFSDLKRVASSHRNQPLYSVPASFFNNYSYAVLNIYISNLFGLTELAYYSMSFRMLGVPLSLISVNLSKVFFEKASREYEETNDIRRTYLATSGLLCLIAIPMVVMLILLAPALFSWYYGASWRVSGEYVAILAPMFGVRLIVTALAPTMVIIRKQKWDLIIQSFFLIASSIIYFGFGKMISIKEFLLYISISFSLVYLFYYLFMLINAKAKNKKRTEE